MNSTRRSLLLLAASFGAASLMGCGAHNEMLTQSLFENSHYVENVSSILISADGKKIVVMTEKYHYIFDAPAYMVAALQSPFHHVMRGELGMLYIKSSGAAQIRYKLFLEGGSATPAEMVQAAATGFKPSAYRVSEISIDGELRGTRYSANGVKPPTQAPTVLNHPYQVSVDAELTGGETAMRALVTPITVTADGAMVLASVAGAILLFPLTIAMFLTLRNGIGIPGGDR